MKAVVYYGPGDLRFEDVETPRLESGEVLIRTRAASICGSDLSAYKKATPRRKPPLVMGHEATGDVAAVGPGVTRIACGDRVAVQPLQFCGHCVHCCEGRPNLCLDKRVLGIDFPGAYAEYFKVPEGLIHGIPDSLSYIHGALAEPVAVVLHAVRQAGSSRFDNVLILGAGMMGLLLLSYLRTLSVGRIFVVDVNPEKLQLAHDLGADLTINSLRQDPLAIISDATGGMGCSTVFEAVGASQTLCQGMACCKKGGRVVVIGTSEAQVEINVLEIVFKELELVGTYVNCNEFAQAIELLASGTLNLEPLISVEKPLSEADDAFALLADNGRTRIKAVLVNDSTTIHTS